MTNSALFSFSMSWASGETMVYRGYPSAKCSLIACSRCSAEVAGEVTGEVRLLPATVNGDRELAWVYTGSSGAESYRAASRSSGHPKAARQPYIRKSSKNSEAGLTPATIKWSLGTARSDGPVQLPDRRLTVNVSVQ